MRITFDIDMPDSDLRVGESLERSEKGYSGRQFKRFAPLIKCLETLVNINLWQLARYAREGRPLVSLYESGVVYKPEPPGCEDWPDIPTLYRQQWGDCEDLACARVAELRFIGIGAVPIIKSRKIPTLHGALTLVHVMVLWPDGSIEDPSKILGMKGDYQ